MKDNFIKTVQLMTAMSIGPSALRNQGVGILQKAQKFCSEIDLRTFSSLTEKEFILKLDNETGKLLDLFGIKARPWGTARKSINLFLREALYNKYLSKEYGLENIQTFLEIPLDSAVSKGLKRSGLRGELPQWPGLKSLTKRVSNKFQEFALTKAGKDDLIRVHLDMYLWLENR